MMFGNVVIGMGVMVVTGLLNDIREDFAVSVSTAGHLIGYGAAAVCIGAPLLAAVVSRWDRRRLLIGSMLWYGLFHALATVAGSFNQLLWWRVIALVSAAVFTPQAAACIGALVPASQRGRAITFVFLGWSVASVLGNPLGAWIGGTLGWRWTMGLMAALSLLSALWLAMRMPSGIASEPLSAAAWRRTLLSSSLMLTLAITVLSAAGQFTLFSYLAPFMVQGYAANTEQLSLLFLAYGLCGFIGNALVSRWIDHLGPPRAMALALSSIALGLGCVGLTHSYGALVLAMLPWGLGVFASNSAQQARLVNLAPLLAPASIALNTSAMYAGQALGAAGGGWLLGQHGLGVLPLAGCVVVLMSLALSLWAARWAQRHPVHPTL
jgi:predicted MFS family arabinose efflux permease